MNNAEKFKEVFGIYATELWAKPEKDFLEWLNAPAPETEDEKCDHYRPNGGYANVSQCFATKERDPCVCDGIRSKCDLHPALPMWKE